MRSVLAIAGAAVAISGTCVDARHYSNTIACSGWRHGECVAWNRLTRKQAGEIKVGYVFGPHYTYYSDYSSLPHPVVTEYHLTPNYRYVSADGYVYVVDPHSYAVTRVITVPNP